MIYTTNRYRAMHYSAKRGLAIAGRPSVCPSVTLVDCDHIDLKLISRTISLTPSLFVAKRLSTYSQGTRGNFGETIEVGWGKSGVLKHKSGNISETRYYGGPILLTAYSPTLFRTVPFPTSYTPSPLDWRFATPTQNSNRKLRGNVCT